MEGFRLNVKNLPRKIKSNLSNLELFRIFVPMENLSKQILSNCINLLSKSTDSGFSRGDLDDWSEFAKIMRRTINGVIPQLKSVSESIKPQTSSAGHPTDKEVEAWFKENITEDCSASSAIYKFRIWLKDREISELKNS
jgi:hypothetical protein